MTIIIVLSTILLFTSRAIAQQEPSPQAVPPVDMRGDPRISKIGIVPHPMNEVASLQMLVDMATLILDGTVLSSHPSVQRTPNIPHSVSTDAVVGVRTVLKGEIPGDGKTILLYQVGGTANGIEVYTPDDPLVRSGERYILF